MARPTKNNAEYFSHDAGMRNDPKIRALRKRFTNGYAIYCMLLEVLTSTDYFTLEIDEIQLEILAGDFDTDAENLHEVIKFCVKIKLLNLQNSKLNSCGLNKRLQGVLDKRNIAKERFKKQKPENNNVSVTETTQSKVKYSKVKESKDNNSNYYPSTAGAEAVEDFSEKAAADFEIKSKIIPFDEVDFPEEDFNVAWKELQNERFFELIQMQHEKDVQKILYYFKIFYQEKWAEKKLQTYPSKMEFFKNFFRWIPYRKSIEKNQQSTSKITVNKFEKLQESFKNVQNPYAS